MASINGTAGGDNIDGTDDPDTIRGFAGDDTIGGGGGADSVDGGDGNDWVIAEAGEGFAKHLRTDRPGGPRPGLVAVRDEAGQVDFVCRSILDAREAGTALKRQAVLFRSAHHSAPLEVDLVRRNIPFVKFGGLKFLEAAHV